jgi:uncharacterized protein (TIGR03382 family)
VRAVDLADNKSNPPAGYNWIIDRTPPLVAVLSPGHGTTVNTLRPIISGTSEALATVYAYINGTEVCEALVGLDGKWSCQSSESFVPDSHKVTARARDLADNLSGETLPIQFFIDTDPPDTEILQGPPNPHNSKHAFFTVRSTDGSKSFDCVLDGEQIDDCQGKNQCSATDLTGCTVTFSLSVRPRVSEEDPEKEPSYEGPHMLEVRARDPGGNSDPTPATYFWEVGVYLANGSEVQKIGGAPILNGNWEFTKALPDGDNSLAIDATDKADNTSPRASISFRVEPLKDRAAAIGGGLGCSSAGAQPWLALLGLLVSSAWLSRRRR